MACDKYRRLRTRLDSFLALRSLSQEDIDKFMRSYVIYSLDWKDEEAMVHALGVNYPEEVGKHLVNYYRVVNHLCAVGDLEKMYIPPIMNPELGIVGNQIIYEEQVAEEISSAWIPQLPRSMHKPKLLELGCGRGRISAHMSFMTGASITGINIDPDQVADAISYNKASGLENDFIRADFNKLPLPFDDDIFNGCYQVQAFSLAKDLESLFSELYRVLKPGAKSAMLDWVMLDAFNPKDERHQQLLARIKPLVGAVGTPTPKSIEFALERVGFKVISSGIPGHVGNQAALIKNADGYYRILRKVTFILVRFGLLPAHFRTLFERLSQDCDAMVVADLEGLVTTTYHWLAVKPVIQCNKT